MDHQHSDILSTSLCPSSEVLRQYQDGVLPAEQNRFVELHLADCEMCTDELEGMSLVGPEELKKRTSAINNEIKRKLFMNDKRIVLLDYRWIAAASVLLLLGFMFYFNKKADFHDNHRFAQEVHESEMDGNKKAGSLLIEKQKSDADKTTNHSKDQKKELPLPSASALIQDYPSENTQIEKKSMLADDLVSSDISFENEKNDHIVQKEESQKANARMAQLPQLVGVVKDPTGYPIPGATIIIKGASKGTISDMDGVFKLDTSGMKNVSVIVNMIGFDKQELAVNNKLKDTLRVNLVEESIRLDEVVVIGYGTTKKKAVTGAVSKISVTDFLKPKKGQPATTATDPKVILAEQVSKALQFELNGHLDSALFHYKKAVQIEPKHTKAQLSIIYCYLKTDRVVMAEYKIGELLEMKNFEPLKNNLQQLKKLINDEEDKKAIQLINRMRH